MSEFNKVSGYKINIQKSVVCLHSKNEYIETEIKYIILFSITEKNNVNLTKYV